MSKFDYELFRNYDTFERCFAVNKKYSIEEAVELLRHELRMCEYKIYYRRPLHIFESYVEFGFYSIEGERYNGWHIRDVLEPVEKKRNSVEVWVIKIDW